MNSQLQTKDIVSSNWLIFLIRTHLFSDINAFNVLRYWTCVPVLTGRDVSEWLRRTSGPTGLTCNGGSPRRSWVLLVSSRNSTPSYGLERCRGVSWGRSPPPALILYTGNQPLVSEKRRVSLKRSPLKSGLVWECRESECLRLFIIVWSPFSLE